MIAEGKTDTDATDAVLREWGRLAEDEEDGVQVWLSLAATQAQLGRLEARIRDRALAVIDAGGDLRRWEEDAPQDVGARRRALAKLRDKLVAEPSAPKRVRKQSPMKPKFSPGDIVAYRLDDGRSLLLRVVGHAVNARSGDAVAVMEVADWIGKELPDKSTMSKMPPIVQERGTSHENSYWAPLVLGPSIRGRLSIVGQFDPPPPPTRTFRRFGLVPSTEHGWHLAYPAYLRWDALPRYALHLLGGGPDPNED